jgi:hypothetical protein
MLDSLLVFLKDPINQAMLGCIGGGIAAIAAGGWAVMKFFAKKDGIRADRSSVAVGRDNINSSIKIDTRHSDKR